MKTTKCGATVPNSAVPLHDRHGSVVGLAVISTADAEEVSLHRWHYHSNGYIQTKVGNTTLLLHQLILRTKDRTVDHKNRDKTDCRRVNLRSASYSENNENRERLLPMEERPGTWSVRHGRRGDVTYKEFDSSAEADKYAAGIIEERRRAIAPPPVIPHESRSSLPVVGAPVGRRNTSGVRGVSRYKGKWSARILKNGERVFLGVFDNVDDASTAIRKASQ